MEKIPEVIHQSWHPYLQPLFDDPKMIMLKNLVSSTKRIYPAKEYIFRVFKKPIDQIKVVILGQDPYSRGEAIGYSFAVDRSKAMPASLAIIHNEIKNSKAEIQSNIFETANWRELKHWRDQGVFLLNAALTVEALGAGSHTQMWEWFTKRIVNTIASVQPCIWLLWGAKAKAYKSIIGNQHIVRTIDIDGKLVAAMDINKVKQQSSNIILEADHPAAETYPGSKYKFTGCNHFVICNQILKLKGQSIINW
jgi:uracil-DNA glycosylase